MFTLTSFDDIAGIAQGVEITNPNMVERIRRAFYKEQANSNIMLTYRLGPISDKNEPSM